MGLIDVLNGMQKGPRGPSNPSSSSGSSGGMSPITMALLGLLAFKALKSFTSQSGTAPAHPAPSTPAMPKPGTTTASGTSAGGVGDILKNGLGGLLAGGAAGSVLSGGLNDLLKQLQDAGKGDVAKSWVSNGPNKSISSDDLAKALGADQISSLMSHSGMSRQDLLESLAQNLPDAVNHLTPEGRVPTEHELARTI
jgi:uncharacterized protein YidB (DUF937 family)